jgi:outer membrane lipoprotein-sorting protein
VWLGLRDGRLAWIESVDALGNRNRIRLLDVKLGAPPDRLFAFTPPKGVEVLPLQ